MKRTFSSIKIIALFAGLPVFASILIDEVWVSAGDYKSLIGLLLYFAIFIASKEKIRISTPKIKVILMLIMLAVGCAMIRELTNHIVVKFFKMPLEARWKPGDISLYQPLFWMWLVLVCLLEELVYRNNLIKILQQKYNMYLVVLFGVAIFVSIHSWWSISSAAIVGIISICLILKFDNILYPILFHFVFNVMIITSHSMLKPYFLNEYPTHKPAVILLTLAMGAIGAYQVFWRSSSAEPCVS